MTEVARRYRRAPIAGLIVVFALLATQLVLAAGAWAHATVARSDPPDGARLAAAPVRVTITFDEPVDVSVGYLRVIDTTGRRVDTAAVTHPGGAGDTISVGLVAGLGPATYVESWRVVSADSHPVAGSIRFVVGAGALDAGGAAPATASSRVTTIAFDVVRTLDYAGLTVLGGAWLVLTIWPAGRADRRARRILVVGWVAVLTATVAEILLQGAYAAGVGLTQAGHGSLLGSTARSDYGRLHVARLFGLGVLAVLVFARSRPVRRAWPEWLPVGALWVGVLLTYSGSGHDSVTSPRWLSIASDVTHLGAVSAWLGGLVLIGGAVLGRAGDVPGAAAGADPDRDPGRGSGVVGAGAAQAVVARFSAVALACVAVLVGTGTYQAWRQVGSVGALTSTSYGRLVLAKVALLAAIVAVAAGSRRLTRSWAGPTTTDGAAPALGAEVALRRRVLLETGVAAAVLAVTAVLVAQPPARETARREPRSGTVALTPGRTATVRVAPGAHGPVSVELMLHGGDAQRVTLTAALPAAQIGPLPVALSRRSAGRYRADDVVLPQAGVWTFGLVVQNSEFDAVTASVTLPIR